MGSGSIIAIAFDDIPRDKAARLEAFQSDTIRHDRKSMLFDLNKAGLVAPIVSFRHYAMGMTENLEMEIELPVKTEQKLLDTVVDFVGEVIRVEYNLPFYIRSGSFGGTAP